jgi:plasmid stabilization system protein ParE
LLYGGKPHVYRAIYRVLEKQKVVEVLHIRHGARREFTASGLVRN